MSEIYQKQGDNDKALDVIKEGREYFDTNVDLIISELNFYLGSEDFVKAEELLKLAVQEDPNNAQLFLALGSSYDALDNYEKAEESYKEAVDIDPSSFDANYGLGGLYYNKAVEMFDKANDISDFKKADNLMKKAEVIMLKSLPYMEVCYKINPEDKTILTVLKALYYRNGDDVKYKEVSG